MILLDLFQRHLWSNLTTNFRGHQPASRAAAATVPLPAANTGLEENSDILRMSVGDTQEEYMFASLSIFVNLWKLQKVARLPFEYGEGTLKVSYCYGPPGQANEGGEEKKVECQNLTW